MKENTNIRMQSFNLGEEVKNMIKKNKHINWSAIVRSAIIERVNLEQKIIDSTRN